MYKMIQHIARVTCMHGAQLHFRRLIVEDCFCEKI